MASKITLEDRYILNEALTGVLESLGYSLPENALDELTHLVANFVETHEQ